MDYWYVSLPDRMLSGELLGRGGYASVRTHPDYPNDWVIKHAENDGTRTYLEWCLFMQRRGRRLRGMPEVDWVVGQGRDEYVACLRRYRPLWSKQAGEQCNSPLLLLKTMGCWEGTTSDLHMEKNFPGYIKKLVKAFEKFAGNCWASDCHRSNFMYDQRRNEIILTDPSSNDYQPTPGSFRVFDWDSNEDEVTATYLQPEELVLKG